MIRKEKVWFHMKPKKALARQLVKSFHDKAIVGMEGRRHGMYDASVVPFLPFSKLQSFSDLSGSRKTVSSQNPSMIFPYQVCTADN